MKKCLHGETQNSNEALNSIIWNKCPKNVYVGRPVLEMGVHAAVLEFNEGSYGINAVFNRFGILIGFCTQNLSERRDAVRVGKSTRKSIDGGKKRRKRLRAVKKGLIDKEKEIEPKESYVAGGF